MIDEIIKNALIEDIGDGDHSSLSCVPENGIGTAKLIVKGEGVIAGIELAKMIFNEVDLSLEIEQFLQDGDRVKFGDIAFIVKGNSISILTGERLALNCMQHMSAIATKTAYLNTLIADTNCKLLDTRKTTPLNRTIEKWAVKIGGGVNHRFGLYDMIMIKDNHIDFAGGITKAILTTKEYLKKHKLDIQIVVEARDLEEIQENTKKLDDVAKEIKRIFISEFPVISKALNYE